MKSDNIDAVTKELEKLVALVKRDLGAGWLNNLHQSLVDLPDGVRLDIRVLVTRVDR